jgi:hypothetical protein
VGSGRESAGSAASRRSVRLVTCGTAGGPPPVSATGTAARAPAALRASTATTSAARRPTAPPRSGDDVGGVHVPVQQQDLDQDAGRGGLAGRAAGRRPQRLVGAGEHQFRGHRMPIRADHAL